MKQWMINCVLFIICLTALGFSLMKITPFEIEEEAYVGIITTLLSLAVAFVIGYQIYNAVELKNDIKEQRRLLELTKKENDEYKNYLVKQKYQTQEGFDIISALMTYNNGGVASPINAFAQMHHALLSSIETDRTDYEWIFMNMRKFISEFSSLAFIQSSDVGNDGNYYICDNNKRVQKLSEFIDSQLKPLYEEGALLRKNPNFVKIEIEYNRVMKAFTKALDIIKENPIMNVMPEDFKKKILNPT
nr:hypothetical protein [uncultured Prevotella sp.]